MSDSDPFRKSMMSGPAAKTAATGGGIAAVVVAAMGWMTNATANSNETTRSELTKMRESVQALERQQAVILTRMNASDKASDAYKQVVAEALGEIKAELKEGNRRRRR